MKNEESRPCRRELERTKRLLEVIEQHHRQRRGQQLPVEIAARKLDYESPDNPRFRRALHRALSIDQRYYTPRGSEYIRPFPLAPEWRR